MNSRTFKPTNELRFQVREQHAGIGVTKTVRMLQQKWENSLSYEWRDVPEVKEEQPS